MTSLPSSNRNEGASIAFGIQPELRLYNALGRWVKNVGTQNAPWLVSAFLLCPKQHGCNSSTAESLLLGNKTAVFVNGTATFKDLAIGREGSDYVIVMNVTTPSYVDFSVRLDNIHVVVGGDGLKTTQSASDDSGLVVSCIGSVVAVVVAILVVMFVIRSRNRRKRSATVSSDRSMLKNQKMSGGFPLNNNNNKVTPIFLMEKKLSVNSVDFHIPQVEESAETNFTVQEESEIPEICEKKTTPPEILFHVNKINSSFQETSPDENGDETMTSILDLHHTIECSSTTLRHSKRLSPIPESMLSGNSRLSVGNEFQLADISQWEQVGFVYARIRSLDASSYSKQYPHES